MNRRAVMASAAGVLAASPGLGAWASGQGVAPIRPGARIVVTGSYLVEILIELGAARQIVGVGGGVDHITALKATPRLRGFRQMSAETILAQRPDVFITTPDITGGGVVAQLKAAGVQVIIFEQEPTLAGVTERIAEMGAILSKPREAAGLARRFNADLAQARALVARARTRPRGLFILSGGNRPTLVAGRGTGPANLIELAGGRNAAAVIEGFKVMSQESMVAAAPEFILLNPDGMENRGGGPAARPAPGALLTPAGRSTRLITLPGEYLQGFGILTPT
ncbi:MAG: hemin ABC transporter substrate-binding protein, partial [Phenylobacterium sp.]